MQFFTFSSSSLPSYDPMPFLSHINHSLIIIEWKAIKKIKIKNKKDEIRWVNRNKKKNNSNHRKRNLSFQSTIWRTFIEADFSWKRHIFICSQNKSMLFHYFSSQCHCLMHIESDINLCISCYKETKFLVRHSSNSLLLLAYLIIIKISPPS